MRIILDTNIFIEREDNKIISGSLQELLRLLNSIGAIILVHPKSIEEINNDRYTARKNIVLSKIKSYNVLDAPPNPIKDTNFESYFGSIEKLKDSHDVIDLYLLYSIFRNAAEFLITEDKGIHSKSIRLGLADRIIDVLDAITIVKALIKPKKEIYSPPSIVKRPLHNLKLEDPFFDDLKKDYGPSFNEWYTKKAKEGKEAYVYLNKDDTLGAFLMLKEENEEINSSPKNLPKKNRLKISTLKVLNIGNKLGELFLNITFKYAVNNGFDEIYLTHFVSEDDRLIPLIESFGFVKDSRYIEHNHTKNKEFIFIKNMLPTGKISINILKSKYFPCYYDGPAVDKFIVPIRPEYHERLFMSANRQTRFKEFHGEFIVEGNTIQKAYLCNAPTFRMKTNDILIFYHSTNNQAITSLGTIDFVHYNLRNIDEIINYVAKRTVYTKKEIEDFKKPLTVILFKFHFQLPKEINYNDLLKQGILKSAPQTIIKLNHEAYLKIKKLAQIDPRFTISNLEEMSQ